MKKYVTLREALSDKALLGDALPGDSWSAWRTVLIAAMGEALTPEEREVFTKLTGGRESEPGEPVETLLVVAGRRSGKTRALSVLATYLATLCSWADSLFIGETGICLYQAPTQRQAATALKYSVDLIDHVELLKQTVENRTADTLTLRHSIELTAQAANWRYSRGSTCVCCILDECAFFHNAEDSANSDEELLSALMPSLGTTGGPMCIASSPKDMQGIVYTLHKKHFGKDGDPKILVIQSESRLLNPSLKESVVARAYAADPVRAESEYGGTFREPVSAYIERSIVEKAVEKGVHRRVPLPGIQYSAFIDTASGGGSDSYVLTIGHRIRDDGRDICVVDEVYSQEPPFDPDRITAEAAKRLKEWGIREVFGDAYAGQWPISAMARNGIRYVVSPLSKSELYIFTLPIWNAGRVKMLDQPRAVEQFCALRRRVGQGSTADKVDHPRNSHDDHSNAVAGLLWRLSPVEQVVAGTGYPIVVTQPIEYPGESSQAADNMQHWLASSGQAYTVGKEGIHRGVRIKTSGRGWLGL